MQILKRTRFYTSVILLLVVGIPSVLALNGCNVFAASTPTPQAQNAPSVQNAAVALAQTTSTVSSQTGNPQSAQPQFTPGARGTLGAPPQTRTALPVTPTAARLVGVTVKATGNLVSASQASLAFQTAGRIKEIKAKEGDRVKAGTVIAALDNVASLDAQVLSANANLDKVKAGPSAEDVTIAKAAVDRAKAAVDQAQASYDRIGGASNPASGASSQSLTLHQAYITYQEALARFNQAINHPTPQELNAAIASAESAKQSAAGARLTAPFDGTVLWIGVRVGESSSSGTAAAAVADLSRMQVQVNVDEISAAMLRVGQSATIVVDALPEREFKGRVSKIALLGTATGNLVTVPVTIDIDPTDAPIYPGLSATVVITGNP